MEEIFVTKLRINKVRHLENLEIPLSETERKHLILTGKNGSGKTSVLEGIKARFKNIATVQKTWGKEYYDSLNESALIKVRKKLIELGGIEAVLEEKKQTSEVEKEIFGIDIFFSDEKENSVFSRWQNSEFITQIFSAKRNQKFIESGGPKKLEKNSIYGIEQKVGHDFLQFLVNFRYDRLDLIQEKNHEKANQIDIWFNNFEKSLQKLYNDDTLKLVFYRSDYQFYILQEGHEPFSLNQLSDGYASILEIVSELIMEMSEKKEYSHIYDLQGVVLIDEIETHLHIDLQKKILPFLTSFFPKIQFIVTTHSPFVLSSVDNAVIYDLEKQQVVEDLSDYSYQELVETYFGIDQYSDVVKQKLGEYELLIKKDGRTEEEEDKLYEIRRYFRKLPFFLSQELQLKIQELELYKLPEQAI